jgi:sucrose phosphorylase
VNSTFYSALGGDDSAYLAARCLQFFVPGIPQVYYVGALAGANDMALFASTGVGRDINRHHFIPSEIAERASSPVVASLLALMRFRNEHPAFAGRAKISHSSEHIAIDWWSGGHWARMRCDAPSRSVRLSWTTASGDVVEVDDLLSLSVTLQWDRVVEYQEPVSV